MEIKENNQARAEPGEQDEAPFLDPRDSGIWIITTILGLSIIFMSEVEGLEWVFFGKLFWMICFLVCNPIAIKIAGWLRNIAAPDAFLSSGMIETLKVKLFWYIGPQSIGALIAFVVSGLPLQWFL